LLALNALRQTQCDNRKIKLKLTAFIETNFNKLFWFVSAFVFVLIAMRAFFIPFSHDETATFFFYIQTDDYLPYKAHVYTNNHFLNSVLANLCYHIAGSHRFVLRLPNILSFVLLCFGVFKHFKYLKTVFSKIILVTFFLFTINFLDFFELCRGYGLSFGFIVLGLAYLMDYFHAQKIKDLLIFSVCLQSALAANLILVVLFTILLFFVFFFQIRNKLFFKPTNLLIQLFNLAILAFWIKFSFFYKEQGSLDYGVGDNYWNVTFKTLMLFLFGTNALWLQIVTILGFSSIMVFAVRYYFQSPVSINKLFTPQLFYAKILGAVILAFYVQKKLLGVGLPEDRTGVFFYVLFVLCFAFVIDQIPQKIATVISVALMLPSLVFFGATYNTHDFSSFYYHTVPKEMYDTLKEEAQKSNELITIGGHRVREMNFAFLNYRGNSVLNDMDDSEQMIMNCDYYIAMKKEQPYYKYFYDEIGQDVKWDRALLKRKEKIQRSELYKMPGVPKNCKGNYEYFEFFRLKDSVLHTRNCVEVEMEVKFNAVPTPLLANIIVQVNDTKGEAIYYKRVPLNWLADNLNGQTKRVKLTTGALPDNTGDVVVYIWNYKQVDLDFTVNEIKILELKGKGVNFMIPESYYKLIGQDPNNPLL
jgi:hypothetical protein